MPDVASGRDPLADAGSPIIGPMLDGLRAILMLTPDQDSLDRRIAQEAGTLAARGWTVDIYPTHGPLDPHPSMLGPGVSMLPRPGQPTASRARALKHLLRDTVPPLHRVVDHVQSRVTDRARQIADWNAEYFLGHGPYAAVFAHDVPVLPLALRIKGSTGAPVICDLHEIYSEMDTTASAGRTRAYWGRVEATYLPQADGILCVNAAVEEHAARYREADVAIAVVRNSVPYVAEPHRPDCEIRSLYPIPPANRVLAFAGRLVGDANVENLVLGFGRARLDGWSLALLGDGPLRRRLEELVATHELAGRVFLGVRVPEPDLVPTLASAQAAALPYVAVDRNHLISTPNKLFEYAQARLPIAASRLPMIERFIHEHGDGAFVDYSSVEGAAATLRRFVLMDLEGFSAETLEAVARNVCWEKDEPMLLAVFEAAMARRDRLGQTAAATISSG